MIGSEISRLFKPNRKHKIETHSKLLAKTLEEIEGRDFLGSLNFKELLALKDSLEDTLSEEPKIAYKMDKQISLYEVDLTADKTIPLD